MPHTNIQWFRYKDVFSHYAPQKHPLGLWRLLVDAIVCLLCLSSIMNSLVIVLFLSGMVAMIMLRTLHKDIARYNQVDQVKSTAELQMYYRGSSSIQGEISWETVVRNKPETVLRVVLVLCTAVQHANVLFKVDGTISMKTSQQLFGNFEGQPCFYARWHYRDYVCLCLFVNLMAVVVKCSYPTVRNGMMRF